MGSRSISWLHGRHVPHPRLERYERNLWMIYRFTLWIYHDLSCENVKWSGLIGYLPPIDIHFDIHLSHITSSYHLVAQFQPLWTIWKSGGMTVPNIWKKIKMFKNHQPAISWGYNVFDIFTMWNWEKLSGLEAASLFHPKAGQATRAHGSV